MSQSRQNKGNAGQRCQPYASSAASSAANDKLRVGVPDDLKLVYLDVQDGTKAQPFQENLNAFSSYAGSNVEDGGSIGEFILDLSETILEKPTTPGTDADETDRKIWEGECSQYVRAKMRRRQSLSKMYNIIWGCCTIAMRGKVKQSAGFKDDEVKTG